VVEDPNTVSTGTEAAGIAAEPAVADARRPSVSTYHPQALARHHGRAEAIVTFVTTPRAPLLLVYAALATGAMMLFAQGDVLYNAFVANKVALGHLQVYAYFSSTRILKPIDTVMPPLFYLVTGLYLKILMLAHLDPVTVHPHHLYVSLFGHNGGIYFSLGLLLLKMPNLVAVIVGISLAAKLARDADADSRVATLLWAASPILIVTALMQAQNDAIPAAITIAALVALRSRGVAWTMLLIGLAACFKTYALVLIPVTALLLSNRDFITAVKYCVLGALPPVIVALPFLGHDFLHRIFGAHDGGTLYASSYIGRMPTHLWPIGYLGILVLAWVVGKRRADIVDVLSLWFLALGLIFVINWWVPQWIMWLLPAVIIFAARDRIFAWAWVVAIAAVLANNLFNFPANMDGGMLMPIYGDHNHPAASHYYAYHVYLLYKIIPYDIRDGVYIVSGIAFLTLCVRALQWLVARAQLLEVEARMSAFPGPAIAALVGPLLLIPYVAVMVAQRLAG